MDANARVQVLVGDKAVGTRRAVNFLAGENVTLAAVDNPATESVNVRITSVGGDGSAPIIGPETVSGLAGEALAAFDLCYLKADGRYYKANSLSVATTPGLVMAETALNTGQAGTFIRRGQVTNSRWAWAMVGRFVYVGTTARTLTQTPPSKSGEQAQIVGIAKNATQIDFEPNLLMEIA